MKEDYVVFILKSFVINIYTYMAFYKIINEKHKNWITIILSSIGISGIYTITRIYSDNILPIIIMYLLQTIILKCSIKNKKYTVMIANLIANAIVYMALVIAVIVNIGVIAIFKELNVIINLITTLIIEFLILYLFFKIRRFKNGFSFLQNKANGEYLDIIMINISAVIMFAYCLFGKGTGNGAIVKQILFPFIILVVIMIIMIQKTLTLYYKQKQLEKNIQEYEKEIKDKDNKIEELSKEKFEISKLNHEFYNRQKAMQLKVDNLLSNMNTEMANEISVIDQINNLSKEYSNKLEEIKHIEKLPTTEIEEIDDMFKYMQSECIKNNIDFKLQINGNIRHLVNKIIPQDKLVTLIGDHIRDAIIAVNHSQNKFRSIVTVIEEKDKIYELRISDTGIEFEPKTLLKLGLEPATTHKEEGGTGIGFITTFETLKETKGTLIIEEKHPMKENDFTKTLIFRFDGKAEYKILTYRSEKIKDKTGRITIENIKK
ncbi:MAG: hypothetical protein Q4C11_00670 [Clostridium sp.]|nr:hypothetical protein [Clostridium sp.]